MKTDEAAASRRQQPPGGTRRRVDLVSRRPVLCFRFLLSSAARARRGFDRVFWLPVDAAENCLTKTPRTRRRRRAAVRQSTGQFSKMSRSRFLFKKFIEIGFALGCRRCTLG